MKKPLEVLRLYPPHDYTLKGAFESRAGCNGEQPFMLFEERTWSWDAAHGAMEKIASLLVERSVTKGGRVAVMGRNSDGH
ncbi:MAG: hypothetical protein ACXWUB_03210, partial [Burkholderiales bacterium]